MSTSSTPSSLEVLVSSSSEETVSKTYETENDQFPNQSHDVVATSHPKSPKHFQNPKVASTYEHGAGSSTNPSKRLQTSMIFTLLRTIVAQKTAELRAMSSEGDDERAAQLQIVPYQPPNEINPAMATNLQIVPYQPPEQVTSTPNIPEKRTKTPTTLAGDIFVSFELPEGFPDDPDIEMLVPEGSGSPPQTPRQFSFFDRLTGWRITRRRRVKGSYDTYYQHIGSNTNLRSVLEVVRFIMYEEDAKQAARRVRIEGDDEPTERRMTPEAREAMVEEFMKSSFHNKNINNAFD